MVPRKAGTVPEIREMRWATWQKIAKKILEMIYEKEGFRSRDRDFKELGHKRSYIYNVRNELLRMGIIRKFGREYEMVVCRFYPWDDLLRCVDFIRSENPDYAEVGVKLLKDACSILSLPDEELKTFEGFLQATGLRALVEGKDWEKVVHVPYVKEVWELFEDILGEKVKFSKSVRDAALGVLLECLKHVNFHKDEKRLMELMKKLFIRVRKVAIEATTHKTLRSAFRILREMNVGDDPILTIIKRILMRRGKELKGIYPEIHDALRHMDEAKSRSKLLNWTGSKNHKLRSGAFLFLRVL